MFFMDVEKLFFTKCMGKTYLYLVNTYVCQILANLYSFLLSWSFNSNILELKDYFSKYLLNRQYDAWRISYFTLNVINNASQLSDNRNVLKFLLWLVSYIWTVYCLLSEASLRYMWTNALSPCIEKKINIHVIK